MNFYFDNLLKTYRDIWYQSQAISLDILKPNQLQRKNDKEILRLKNTFINFIGNEENVNNLNTDKNKQFIRNQIQDFMVKTLKVDQWACDILFEETYYETTMSFINRANELNSNLIFDDIHQALRNLWVINSLQIYFGKPVELTESLFAYSMLYPLTDNYLDNPDISKAEKQSFNKRFYKKIKTGEQQPANQDEELIFKMIDLIEGDYRRDEYPQIYTSLLAILDGQNKSLDQLGTQSLYDIDILSYTFYKGGTSVLADAYLVKGDLTNEEALFAYGYGIILQIADDMQDVEDDLEDNSITLFNSQANHSNLDGLYLKYKTFIEYYFVKIFNIDSQERKALHLLIYRSVELLLFEGFCINKKSFSKNLQKKLINHSYFSPRAFNKKNRKLMKAIYDIKQFKN